MPFCQDMKDNSWPFSSFYGNSSMSSSDMIRGEHGTRCMPCSSGIISEKLQEIHTMDKFD